jgi:NADH dehydrogenase
MILVAGGTGRLGGLVVAGLRQRGFEVRVLTRDRRRAAHLEDLDVDIVQGDVRERRGLAEAVGDATCVVSAIHGFAGPGRVSPQSVDLEGNANLVGAAVTAGADVVLVSVVGASPTSALELSRCKYAAEQHLQRSATGWTIVRATAFVELWADMVCKGVVFGRGNNPINFVSVRDVAAAVEHAVVDPASRGCIIEVGGEELTFNQLVALTRELRGEPARVVHIPPWALRVMAPLHRQPRAALAMETADMTFELGARNCPVTSLRQALTDALARPEGPPVRPT